MVFMVEPGATMRQIVHLVFIILCSSPIHARGMDEVRIWRSAVNLRLAHYMPKDRPHILTRAWNLKHPGEVADVLDGRLPLEYAYAERLGRSLGVDPNWILAGDILSARFAHVEDLRRAFANEPAPTRDAVQMAFGWFALLSENDRRLLAPRPEFLAQIARPAPSLSACRHLLLKYSGRELLELQLAITRELSARDGRME